jgi:hypothetical protein
MHKLMPKQYLEQRVRKLPIGKCYINHNWEESSLASVIVSRKHSNGNYTFGSYMVDLLCIGIKDTWFKFNLLETSWNEYEEKLAAGGLVEIDYNLAHNIIYAGHDFAMDYEIYPHKDFVYTKFILEEDNEDIPLIEVHVGDEKDGKPHLLAGPYMISSDIIAKLKKHAGEGNYYHTVVDPVDEFDDDWDDDEFEDEEFEDDEHVEKTEDAEFEVLKNEDDAIK